MNTTGTKIQQLSDEMLIQFSDAVKQAAILNEIRRVDEKLDEVIEHLNKVNMEHNGEIMNKKEACAYAKISNNNLDKWIRKGLKITMIDRTIRIKKSDIDDFMNKNTYLQQVR